MEIDSKTGDVTYQFQKHTVSLLTKAVTDLSSCLDVDQVSETVTKQVLLLLKAQVCLIAGWNGSQNRFELWQIKSVGDNLNFNPELIIQLDHCSRIHQTLKEGRIFQYHSTDPDLSADEIHYFQKNLIDSLLIIPVTAHGMLYGMICVIEIGHYRRFSDQDVVLGHLLGSQTSVAIENARLYQSLKKHSEEMDAIYQVSLGLTASLELEKVLNVILRSAFKLLKGAQDAHIFLYQQGKLEFGAALWASGQVGVPFANPRPDGLTSTVARQGQPIIISDACHHFLYQNYRADWLGSIVGMPLKIGDEVIGVLSIAWSHAREFQDSELRLLHLLADQAALAVERANLHIKIKQQANTDSLTGLPNRWAFDERIADEIRRSIRYHHSFALVMMDLDGFKIINDTYGHPTGDLVLIELGNFLKSSVRDTDFLARYGGDEFVLILPETDNQQVEKMIKKLKKKLVKYVFSVDAEQQLHLSASTGYVIFPTDSDTSSGLISIADRRLYQEKGKCHKSG